MERLVIEIGEKVIFKNREAVIIRIVDIDQVSIQELQNNVIHTVKTSEIKNYTNSTKKLPDNNISALTEKEWDEAQRRFEIIKPILGNRKNFKLIESISIDKKIHYTTIYRWLKLYDETSVISSLLGHKKNGGRGKSRLSNEQDIIINNSINNLYLNPSKKSITKIVRDIEKNCKDKNIPIPHSNTIRKRIKSLSEEEVLKARFGKSKARDKFEPIKNSFPGADYPLSVVQIDHTKVDIILVDEHYRKAFIRPWLTIAVDVYSRMVVGFYLSFDPPGEMGTGLCIANSILSKEIWMERNHVEGEWPCWGIMSTIHVDNAREFRGNMLRKACQNYGINLEFRPVAQPHWGGHVERLLGTFSKEIHNLPGTTFSSPESRINYDSEKNASLTISEFEKWLMTYIVNVYHKRNHSGIGMSPLQKYKEGLMGSDLINGCGIPPKLLNEKRLKLDFMPYTERTIQEYGVIIDHITYYHDVLRKYIHSRESLASNSPKRKFIFRRDPRDISTVYFFDPEINDYFEIPYRDTSKPAISIWEYKEAVRKLNSNNVAIDEEAIFNAYRTMEKIELKSILETKKLKRTTRYADKRNEQKTILVNDEIEDNPKISFLDIKPFEDLDDEAFT
ncbi:Mu transposase C-terminal domain-containing protein [Flavobacterium sp. FlaQc-28]|uniref:Mu transposase C-terminal domain-containing protein n=1 Tax=Flavobacterium sp. FlaQc-28 TaxID=3374178 RepID=UPI0037572BE2